MRALAKSVCVVALMFWCISASAADPSGTTGITTSPDALSDAELDQRIAWLKTTLDATAGYSKFWQYGWASGYTLGIGIGVAQAATTSKNDTRVNSIVTASKAVIGTARMLWDPHPGRLGADPMRAISGDDRSAKLQRLAVGESQLTRVSERAQKRLRWERHVGSVALNLVGGAFVAGFGDWEDALISTAVGVVVGEVMIFSSPKAAASNLSDYQQKFAGITRPDEWQVSLIPTGMGAAIRVDF